MTLSAEDPLCQADDAYPVMFFFLNSLGLNLVRRNRGGGDDYWTVSRPLRVIGTLVLLGLLASQSYLLTVANKLDYYNTFILIAQSSSCFHVMFVLVWENIFDHWRDTKNYLNETGKSFRSKTKVLSNMTETLWVIAYEAVMIVICDAYEIFTPGPKLFMSLYLILVNLFANPLLDFAYCAMLKPIEIEVTLLDLLVQRQIRRKIKRSSSLSDCNNQNTDSLEYGIMKKVERVQRLTQLYNKMKGVEVVTRCLVYVFRAMVTCFLLFECFSSHSGLARILVLFLLMMDDTGRFLLVCWAGQRLKDKGCTLSQSLWTLHSLEQQGLQNENSRKTPLWVLLSHDTLQRRPPSVTIGGGPEAPALGFSTFVTLFNTVLTYSFILYQYKPAESSNQSDKSLL